MDILIRNVACKGSWNVEDLESLKALFIVRIAHLLPDYPIANILRDIIVDCLFITNNIFTKAIYILVRTAFLQVVYISEVITQMPINYVYVTIVADFKDSIIAMLRNDSRNFTVQSMPPNLKIANILIVNMMHQYIN